MRKDNRGITLVEIMVVIAIMAIVAGVGITGLNLVNGRPAQQCAQKIIYSLERHRTTAMSKVDASYTLEVQSSGKTVCVERVSNDRVSYTTTESEIGAKRVKLFYETADGSVVPMTAGMFITFQYDRSSGAFRSITASTGDEVARVIAKSGGREVKVRFVKITGKVYWDLD